MLCGDCRVYYKKYGFDKVILDRPPTPPELVRLREEQNQKATVEDDVSYPNIRPEPLTTRGDSMIFMTPANDFSMIFMGPAGPGPCDIDRRWSSFQIDYQKFGEFSRPTSHQSNSFT